MRTEQIKEYLANGTFAVTEDYIQGIVNIVNSGEIKTVDNEVADDHSYEVIGNIAVITIDGATTKKNTWMNAVCGGFIGYDTIIRYISKAEADDKVEKILFHIDTPGGDVAGVDGLYDAIATSTKETITLYENLGASAGVWYGTASDKVYATEMTQIGSIGVIAGYYEPREDDQKVVLVSKNAKNKSCMLNGDCADKFQARIDETEAIFFSRVIASTGMSKEDIIKHFNSGETIPAKKAFEIGFIDGVTTKKKLLKALATMPSGQEKIATTTQGLTMEQEGLQALLDTANADIDAKQVEIDGITAELEEAKETISKLTQEKEEAVSAKELQAKIVAMALDMGVSKEVAVEMMAQPTADKAEILALKAVQPTLDVTEGITTEGEDGGDEDGETALSDEDKEAIANTILENV